MKGKTYQAVNLPQNQVLIPMLHFNFTSLFPVDEIVSTLGEGAFGKVAECIDHNK